jgi:hypothetical protein
LGLHRFSGPALGCHPSDQALKSRKTLKVVPSLIQYTWLTILKSYWFLHWTCWVQNAQHQLGKTSYLHKEWKSVLSNGNHAHMPNRANFDLLNELCHCRNISIFQSYLH